MPSNDNRSPEPAAALPEPEPEEWELPGDLAMLSGNDPGTTIVRASHVSAISDLGHGRTMVRLRDGSHLVVEGELFRTVFERLVEAGWGRQKRRTA